MTTDHARRTDNAIDWRGTVSSDSGDLHVVEATAPGTEMTGGMRAEDAETGVAVAQRSPAAPILGDSICGCTSTSMTTALIILVASILAAALISSTITWLLVRRRYVKHGGKRRTKKESLSVEVPGARPQWEDWTRSPAQQLTSMGPATINTTAPVAVSVQISPAQPEPDSNMLSMMDAEADVPAMRRRPEYSSGLSSTFLFPRRENGVTVTIMSDAPGAKKGGWMGKSRRQVQPERTTETNVRHGAAEPQPDTLSPTYPDASLNSSSTDRLVAAEERPAGRTEPRTRPRRGTSGKSRAASGRRASDAASTKSAIEALRERLQASHAAAAAAAAAATPDHTEPSSLGASAPIIPKRSSLRASSVPPARTPSEVEAPQDKAVPDDEPNGFPENVIRSRGRQQPFASAIRPPPLKAPPPPLSQRALRYEEDEQQSRPSTPDGRPSTSDRRPSTSDQAGSPGTRRTTRRPRKGTLVMFPKITDGPPPSVAAGLVKSPAGGIVGTSTASAPNTRSSLEDPQLSKPVQGSQQQQKHRRQQSRQEPLTNTVPLPPERPDYYNDISVEEMAATVEPPRRSFGPGWPFKPM